MGKSLCQCCYGSGEMCGGGMMKVHCAPCDGEGYITHIESKPDQEKKPHNHADSSEKDAPKLKGNQEITTKIDKRSRSYKAAVKELEDLGMSKKEAEAEFDKAV